MSDLLARLYLDTNKKIAELSNIDDFSEKKISSQKSAEDYMRDAKLSKIINPSECDQDRINTPSTSRRKDIPERKNLVLDAMNDYFKKTNIESIQDTDKQNKISNLDVINALSLFYKNAPNDFIEKHRKLLN